MTAIRPAEHQIRSRFWTGAFGLPTRESPRHSVSKVEIRGLSQPSDGLSPSAISVTTPASPNGPANVRNALQVSAPERVALCSASALHGGTEEFIQTPAVVLQHHTAVPPLGVN